MQAVDAGKCQIRQVTAFAAGLFSAAALSFFLLVAAAYIALYADSSYFEREYGKYDVLSSLPEMTMSETDGLMAVTGHMMDYLLHGKEPEELQIEVMMGGELRGFFTDREIAHMADVRTLFVIFIRIAFSCLAVSVLILAISALTLAKKLPDYPSKLGAGIITGVLLVALIALALIFFGGDSFSELFVNFHLALFDNDLWLLDPAEDMLINIVPEGFFYDTAIRIGLIFAFFMAILAVIGGFIMRFGKKLYSRDV